MQISVLKFGSSVLRSDADLPRVVGAIRAELRLGRRVVAVVSAFGGATDCLLEQASSRGIDGDAAATARLVATGEDTAAALLTGALQAHGVTTAFVDVAAAGLRAAGPLLDSDPVDLDARGLRVCLERAPVVVLPGFLGVDAGGRVALLGRGGSDLTAIFVAERIGAVACRLVKDVDGLYARDPARAGGSAGAGRPARFQHITWADLLALESEIVQSKAVRYARDHGLAFEVGGLGGVPPTRVGRGPTRRAADGDPARHEPAA